MTIHLNFDDLYGQFVEKDPTWRQQAACRSIDPGVRDRMFFPERGESSSAAKKICAECPVQKECLNYALISPQVVGIWGGKSQRERREMMGQQRRQTRKPYETREQVRDRVRREMNRVSA